MRAFCFSCMSTRGWVHDGGVGRDLKHESSRVTGTGHALAAAQTFNTGGTAIVDLAAFASALPRHRFFQVIDENRRARRCIISPCGNQLPSRTWWRPWTTVTWYTWTFFEPWASIRNTLCDRTYTGPSDAQRHDLLRQRLQRARAPQSHRLGTFGTRMVDQ